MVWLGLVLLCLGPFPCEEARPRPCPCEEARISFDLRRLVASLAPVSGGLSERHPGGARSIHSVLALGRLLVDTLATIGRFSFGGFPVSISVPVVILIGICSV